MQLNRRLLGRIKILKLQKLRCHFEQNMLILFYMYLKTFPSNLIYADAYAEIL